MSGAARRGVIAAAVALVIVALIAVGVSVLYDKLTDSPAADGCTVGDYRLDTDQAAVASTMVGVVLRRDLPERAAVLTLAAALQESKLRNLAPGDGDRDSVGVLQQRPSQGWGTNAQLNDVHYATGKFLDALVKVDNWQTDPLAHVIQEVQISADEAAYAPHESEAQALADTYTGKTPAGITCTYGSPSKVATPAVLAAQVQLDLPVNPPTKASSAITVPGAGWATAAWFVANGDRLGLQSVSFSGQHWVRSKGWSSEKAASSSGVTATGGQSS